MIGYLLTLLLQIYCRVWWRKNFENRLAIRRVTGKNKVAPFFPDTVYIYNIVEFWPHAVLPYLAKADSKEPSSGGESSNDEGQTEQKADVGGRQTSYIAVADGMARLVTITNDHQQDERVSDQTTHTYDSVDGRHRRVDRQSVIHRRCHVGYRVGRHLWSSSSKPHKKNCLVTPTQQTLITDA